MKITLLIILSFVILIFGEWIYRTFLRPIDPLTEEVLDLSKFLNDKGFEGKPYPVRHGYRHSHMLASAAFKIENYPLPIVIGTYPSIHTAKKSAIFNEVHKDLSIRNMVVSFPAWGVGTEDMQSKITHAVNAFDK